ncbi:hypothetical protein CASFOL_027503 [Castilleja foliolosa]|uniref:Uncharacterized protein n=1 Tax=Castilleja foliolosa TaxID=1961234 RepID=A0ABD3CIG3_9LAMI
MQKVELRKGPWLEEEDEQLAAAVSVLGDRRWDALAKASGLRRSGKSCRLRWMNYLRPNLKHGNISEDEEKTIVELHEKWGNKWSRIARRLPGRTDNEIKNYWRSHLRKKGLVHEKEWCSSATECGTSSPCSINDDQVLMMKDDISLGPSDDYSDSVFEMLSLTSSPYETRLTDWMSNYDIFSPGWSSVDCSNFSTWDFSLWDGQ